MPIGIRKYDEHGKKPEEIAWLGDDEWEMPAQLELLEQWLDQNANALSRGSYVADLGFSPRPGAAGGGGVLNTKMMKAMLDMGMELYLSEYPPDKD